jgi:hypothetical protein
MCFGVENYFVGLPRKSKAMQGNFNSLTALASLPQLCCVKENSGAHGSTLDLLQECVWITKGIIDVIRFQNTENSPGSLKNHSWDFFVFSEYGSREVTGTSDFLSGRRRDGPQYKNALQFSCFYKFLVFTL